MNFLALGDRVKRARGIVALCDLASIAFSIDFRNRGGQGMGETSVLTDMHLAADVDVDRPVSDVRAFFADPQSLARWDRSVVKVVATADGPLRVGYTFFTVGPARPGREGRVSKYRVIAIDDDAMCAELVESPIFASARWTMRFAATPRGTRITCDLVASVRRRYFVLAWLLRLHDRALDDDMHYLKRAIEHGEIAKR